MSNAPPKSPALALSALVVVSVVAGSVAFAGPAAAATDTSIAPDDDEAGASNVTYTANGTLELSSQDSLQYIDVHLGPADVSEVEKSDVRVYINGGEYTNPLDEFSASGGAVGFKLSNSADGLNDGDRVRVVVGDVTNPFDDFDANATLHDSGDDQWQQYQDTVDIDTSSNVRYSDLTFDDGVADGNDTTIGVGEDLNVSATVENTVDVRETYNASLRIGGSVARYSNGTLASGENTTVSFVTNFSDPGAHDITIGDELAATEVTVTGPTSIADGSADPGAVASGTTVSDQEVSVQVTNVSRDGDTDWHYVEFPDSLAGNLSVNAANANATSVTSSAELVEGYDDDGVTETAKFATSADGGGDADLNLTVNVSVDYPDGESTYEIDARVVDSDGGTAEGTNVTTIETTDAPSITDYAVSNPADRDVNVSFNSSERLSDIAVDVGDGSGETVATLTEGDFTETRRDGVYTYDAATTLSEDGDYDVALRKAIDADGLDGASGQTESVRLNLRTVGIADGAADPERVSPGSTVNNQEVVVTVANVSADGDADTHYVEFPNALADGLSVNSAAVNGSASIDQSAQLVEGYDDDGTDETIRFETDTDAGGAVDLNVTVDVSVDYPDAAAAYDVDARVEDSDGDGARRSAVTSIAAGDEAAPVITDYAVTNPADREIDVRFNSSRELVDTTVDVTDGSGTAVATLTESDVSETNASGTWVYDATYAAASDGTYTATLTEAADAEGNDAAAGESGTVTLDAATAEIVDGSANPSSVTAGETVDNQHVCVQLADVSADGDTDWHYVEFPDSLAGNLSVNAANANATSVTSSAELVEGYDDDGVTETVTFATSADGGGDIDLCVSVDVSVAYPNGEATYDVDSQLVDSQTGSVTRSGVATIDATTGDDGGSDGSDDGGDGTDGSDDGGDGTDGSDDGGDGTDDSDDDGSDGTDGSDDSNDGDDDDGGSDGGTGGSDTATSAPTVTGFELVADGRDVDAVVTTADPADQLEVAVSGSVDAELTRADFNASRDGGGSVYTADVATGVSGSFEGELVEAAAGGSEATAGQTDTLTVPLPDRVAPGTVAAPSWTGNESVHTFRVPIGANASVAGETLRGVEMEYSDRFLDRGGSISSVSDDQNVAALQVVDPSGTVTSELGDTDAVTVNVADDAVALDLTDVDSSRKPELGGGDRIVVRLRPVTNPAETGRYETTVGVETATGDSVNRTSEVRIRSRSSVEARETAFVEPSDEAVSLDLTRAEAVDSVTVDSATNASGAVRVTVPDDAPGFSTSLSGPVVTALNVSRPDAVENDRAGIALTLSTDELPASGDELALARYDEGAEDWTRLDTSVVSSADGRVTIEATASETSMFALTADGDGSQSERSTGDDDRGVRGEHMPTGDGRPSPIGSSQIGSLAVLASVALIAAVLLLRRRRDDGFSW